MAVIGSYKDDPAFRPLTIHLMCLDTVERSGRKIKKLVQIKTPVLTGALLASIEQTPMTHPYKSWYQIKVKSDDPKARWIEQGTPPHVIRPRDKNGAMGINGKVYAEVHHPGAEGVHMFSRAGSEFEALFADRIAESVARKFLKAKTRV